MCVGGCAPTLSGDAQIKITMKVSWNTSSKEISGVASDPLEYKYLRCLGLAGSAVGEHAAMQCADPLPSGAPSSTTQ
jgi:hypothetical protein